LGEFRQKVKILGENPIIKGSYSYQVCSDIDGKCIPFDEDFTLSTSTINEENPANPDCKFAAIAGVFGKNEAAGILNPVSWVFQYL
jgi:DsbC/DsbD-like thiol-disulfide interchange protein